MNRDQFDLQFLLLMCQDIVRLRNHIRELHHSSQWEEANTTTEVFYVALDALATILPVIEAYHMPQAPPPSTNGSPLPQNPTSEAKS